MPDVNYIITIEDKTGSGKSGPATVAKTQPVVSNNAASASEPSEKVGKAFAVAALGTAIKQADRLISQNIGRVSLANGAEAYQSKVQKEYALAKSTVSTAGAAALSLVAAGPVGAIAAVAMATWGYYNSKDVESEENMRLQTLDSFTRTFQNIRSGIDNRNVETLY